ncbi:MAG: MBOAT family protein [Bacteroidetes bacterium]|nr:MBOAT family protein [Bacteroidota bacterium]
MLFTIMFGFYALIHKHNRIRNGYLLAFSLFFYYKCSGFYFILLLISTILDYVFGFKIFNSSGWRRRFFLFLSIVTNLGLLFYFKYSYFIIDSINYLMGSNIQALNFMASFSNNLFQTEFSVSEIILPVGISFYTFQTLSYSIDIYRGKIEPCGRLLDFAFFVSFFPQLVAGPIVRAIDFLPQINKPYSLSRKGFGNAVFLIATGLVKKVVISDYISVNFVDRVFDNPEIYSGFMNLMAVYGYSIQIYCDFSGYSDMAIGLAALLGFKLPINFNNPYKSKSITEFWRRWHISLSTWLRDYLYISIGGNRKGKIRTYINLLITMLLGGLWHGAALKFIIWGGIHGLGLAFHKLWLSVVKVKKNMLWSLMSMLLTFHFVAFCWMYFRAIDIKTVQSMIHQIFYDFDLTEISSRIQGYWKPFSFILFGFVIHLLPSKFKLYLKKSFSSTPIYIQVLMISLLIFLIYQAKSAEIQPFIYFQF